MKEALVLKLYYLFTVGQVASTSHIFSVLKRIKRTPLIYTESVGSD